MSLPGAFGAAWDDATVALKRQPARHALAGDGCCVRDVGWRKWQPACRVAPGAHHCDRIDRTQATRTPLVIPARKRYATHSRRCQRAQASRPLRRKELERV